MIVTCVGGVYNRKMKMNTSDFKEFLNELIEKIEYAKRKRQLKRAFARKPRPAKVRFPKEDEA
jgi:hypothetical protein